MNNFLFHNDKKTKKDEIFLLIFIIICIGAGLLMYLLAPENRIISESIIKIFGLIWILTGVMFIPSLIYRLIHNE